MGATSMAMRRRMGANEAPPPPAPAPMSAADHARVIQELTVKYEKELSAARAGSAGMTVNVDMSAEIQEAIEKARVEFETRATVLASENQALKDENAELKAQLEALTAPPPPETAAEGGTKKGGRSGR